MNDKIFVEVPYNQYYDKIDIFDFCKEKTNPIKFNQQEVQINPEPEPESQEIQEPINSKFIECFEKFIEKHKNKNCIDKFINKSSFGSKKLKKKLSKKLKKKLSKKLKKKLSRKLKKKLSRKLKKKLSRKLKKK